MSHSGFNPSGIQAKGLSVQFCALLLCGLALVLETPWIHIMPVGGAPGSGQTRKELSIRGGSGPILTSGVFPHADQQGVIFVLCQLLR